MIETIINHLIEKQVKEEVIKKEDISIYKYGYTLVSEVILNIVLAILIAILFEKIGLIFLFLIMYIPLRSFSGGWHASKIWKCTIFSNMILLIVVLCEKYWIQYCTVLFSVIVFSVGVLCIFLMAPIETKAKKITLQERKVYKKKINLMLVVHFIMMILAISQEYKILVYAIMCVYVVQNIMLVMEIIQSKIHHSK